MAKKRTAEQRAAHAKHTATWRKRVRAQAEAAKRAEETSERLKALYAAAPRIGPDGKPLASHARRDEATRSRLSSVTTPPTSTPPPPDQAPATATTTGMVCSGPGQPLTSATTAPPPADPFANLRTPPTSTALVQQDTQVSAGSSASSVPVPGLETAENDLGGFDASFFLDGDINPILTEIQAGSGSDSTIEVAPQTPQIQDPAPESLAASLGSRQDLPLVPSVSEQDSSTPLMTTGDTSAGAMPHYESGMQGLSRFLRLVKDGRRRKQ